MAYQNDWIIVYHDNVIRPDGKPGIYGVVHYLNRSVGIVALDQEGRVLLVGQYRYTIHQYSGEIPADGTDPGEDLLAAAHRELKEETGVSAGLMQPLLHTHLSNSITDEEAYCFLATELEFGEPRPDATEQIESQWVPLPAVLAMISTGEITDALTILGLQRVSLMRLSAE